MTSLLDVPAQLALALSLAAATAASKPARGPLAEAVPPAVAVALLPEPVVGPYRFSERMWLRALKDDLPRDAHDYAQAIFRTSGGRYYVPRPAERTEILAARDDATLAARAARALARSNARMLRTCIGRAPSVGELYIAHLYGPEAAARLILRVRSHPEEAVAKFAPELAAKSGALFGAQSRDFTLAKLYAKLTAPLAHIKIPAPEPSLADLLLRGSSWGALRSNSVAWQAEVSSASPAQ